MLSSMLALANRAINPSCPEFLFFSFSLCRQEKLSIDWAKRSFQNLKCLLYGQWVWVSHFIWQFISYLPTSLRLIRLSAKTGQAIDIEKSLCSSVLYGASTLPLLIFSLFRQQKTPFSTAINSWATPIAEKRSVFFLSPLPTFHSHSE